MSNEATSGQDRAHLVDVQQAPDGELTSLAIGGDVQTPTHKIKTTRAFSLNQSEGRIVLSAVPGGVAGTSKTSDAGEPLTLDLRGLALPDDGRLMVRFEWEDGALVGVRLTGDFPHRIDPENEKKIYKVFRSQHREGEIKLLLDRSDIQGITRLQNADLGDGVEARMYCPSTRSLRRAQNLLAKEPDTIVWLDRITPDDVLWDLGANVGAYTLYGAIKRKCRVIAFEPASANYMALNRNIELNGIQDLATAYCIAVARESAIDMLHMQGTEFGDAFCNFGSNTSIYGEPFETSFRQGMVGFSLDDLAKTLPFPSHLKIDVDGLEKDIVLGGPRLFSDPRVRSAVIELDKKRPELVQEVAAIMIGHGFTFANEATAWDNSKQIINAVFDRAS